MAKDTFIIRTEWYSAISKLTEKEQSIMLCNLFEYHLGNLNNLKLDSLSLQLVWNLIEPNLDRNIKTYDKRCETSALNGALGGRPPKEKPNKPNTEPNLKPNKPKITLSVSVSDSESVIIEKQKIFYSLLTPFVGTYKKEMVRAFYDYWIEPNKSRRKLRWEMEKTWDLSLRLKRWADNQKTFGKQPEVELSAEEKEKKREKEFFNRLG